MSKRIIGVHSGHDASACLLIDNELVCAISKERLTRIKHDSGDPIECVEYILRKFDFEATDIDLVVRSNWHDSNDLNNEYYQKFPSVEVCYQHHLFHAYAVSVTASSQRSIVLVVDGRGCRSIDNGDNNYDTDFYEIESVYMLENGLVTELEKEYRPYLKNKYSWGSHIDSIGYAYAIVSKKIFSSSNAAGKVMALASFSDGKYTIPNPFIYGEGTPFSINAEWLDLLVSYPNKLDWDSPLAKDIAHSIQSSLEQYYQFRTSLLSEKYECSNFSLSGGVALNCKNNGLLANSSWIEKVNLFPACGDEGLCIGAAVWALRHHFKEVSPIRYKVNLGFSYTNIDLDIEEHAEKIATLLKQGNIIGIIQKGSEFGPRALGFRSILSAADKLDYKERLNVKVKRRESFRPFGAMILGSNISKITEDRLANPYMLSAVRIHSNQLNTYPAVVHKDGTIRVQKVEENGGLIHQILTKYEGLTGKVVIINTSFNGADEPIVETIEQARACAVRVGLDYLYTEQGVELIND